jgi:hypothetical protein
MNHKRVAVGLGLFSIVLGAAELFASRWVARGLPVEGKEALMKGSGAREVAAGVGLLAAPGLAARRSPEIRAIWVALCIVAA